LKASSDIVKSASRRTASPSAGEAIACLGKAEVGVTVDLACRRETGRFEQGAEALADPGGRAGEVGLHEGMYDLADDVRQTIVRVDEGLARSGLVRAGLSVALGDAMSPTARVVRVIRREDVDAHRMIRLPAEAPVEQGSQGTTGQRDRGIEERAVIRGEEEKDVMDDRGRGGRPELGARVGRAASDLGRKVGRERGSGSGGRGGRGRERKGGCRGAGRRGRRW
jgi:hypothetical protein